MTRRAALARAGTDTMTEAIATTNKIENASTCVERGQKTENGKRQGVQGVC
jgi:hypothetical protein